MKATRTQDIWIKVLCVLAVCLLATSLAIWIPRLLKALGIL